MNAAVVIAAAFPGHWRAAGYLARALGITKRQGKRIVDTGRIPMRLENPAIDFLEEAIQRRKALLEEAENALRLAKYRHERHVARTQSRVAPPDVAPSDVGSRSRARATQLSLISPGSDEGNS